jgi:hypothetical protein
MHPYHTVAMKSKLPIMKCCAAQDSAGRQVVMEMFLTMQFLVDTRLLERLYTLVELLRTTLMHLEKLVDPLDVFSFRKFIMLHYSLCSL